MANVYEFVDSIIKRVANGYVSLADLASVAATKGANMVGFEDSGNKFTAATADAALDEIAVNLGGTDVAHRNFTSGYVLTDDQTLFASLDALDASYGNTLANLTTTSKVLVGAINEVDAMLDQAVKVASSPTFASLRLTGDLVVEGDRFVGNYEYMLTESNYILQNMGYRTAVGVTGGRVTNYLATATVDTTVGAGVFVAGVGATSDATVTTAGAATFANHDLVMFSGFADKANNGLFEVLSHAANVLTVRGMLTALESEFASAQFTANAGDVGGNITKVTVTVDRIGTDGRLEVGTGAVLPLTYSDVPTLASIASDNITKAYTSDNLAVDNEPIPTTLDKLDVAFGKMLWTMPVAGTWAVDGDGARTNGGGSAGSAVADLVLAVAGANFTVCYDAGDAASSLISACVALTGWSNNWQLTADAASEAIGDYVAFGDSVPFCEIAFDLSALATWNADGGVWEYWNGAAYVAIPAGTFYDNTDTTAPKTGLRSFQRVGAFTFYPPSDWATSTENGQLGYWIRYRVTATEVTQTPILNGVRHDIVSQTDTFVAPHKGVISTIRIGDGAATIHSGIDVKFFLMNYTTGARSSLLTFPQDKRRDRWTGETLAVAQNDVLGVVVVQEDETNEVTNAVLELGVAYVD
jgi:hypothetical protein